MILGIALQHHKFSRARWQSVSVSALPLSPSKAPTRFMKAHNLGSSESQAAAGFVLLISDRWLTLKLRINSARCRWIDQAVIDGPSALGISVPPAEHELDPQ